MKEIEELWIELESRLAKFGEEGNIIKRLELSKKTAQDATEKLQTLFALHDGFNDDPTAQVNYNRNLAPPFYAKFIYFSKVLAFECLRLDEGPDECEKLFEIELACIKRFFQQHTEFRLYYLSEKTGLDVLYFQNHTPEIIHLDELVVGISPNVNAGCTMVACITAFDQYRSYLMTESQKGKAAPTADLGLKWNRSKSDLNEVLIALEDCIDKGNGLATLAEIREGFGNLLHVNLANGDQLDNNRRNNVKDEPNFLQKLAEKMINRKNKLAENQKGRKRRL